MKTESSDQSNMVIAIGKRKEESGRQALPLQDVFSESGNQIGVHQKTLPMSANEHGEMAQLQKKGDDKTRRNTKGGRKKLQPNQRRTIKLQVHATKPEFDRVEGQFRDSGERYLSDYLRILILDERKSRIIVNKKDLIKQLDRLGVQIGRIGNNINQVAKYANIQNKSGKVDQNTMIRFEKLMQGYLKEQRNLINAYRALVRNNE